jgi:hypothetical protein
MFLKGDVTKKLSDTIIPTATSTTTPTIPTNDISQLAIYSQQL